MKPVLWLAAGCCLAAAGVLFGQQLREPEGVRLGEKVQGVEVVRADRVNSERGMYEDIEILRRILDKRLMGLLQFPPTFTDVTTNAGVGKVLADYDGDGHIDLFVTNDPHRDGAVLFRNQGKGQFEQVNVFNPKTHPGLGQAEPVEGTYLGGYGVVFSVSLPVHFLEVVKQPAQPGPRPLSQWERTQRELRGQKVEEEKAPPRQPETVADAVLKVLAENGHHFRSLGETEKLTVAITLRGASSGEFCAKCHAQIGNANSGEPGGKGALGSSGAGMGPGSMAGMPEKPAKPGEPGGSAAGTGKPLSTTEYAIWALQGNDLRGQGETQNQVLLGDLHVKQGRYQEAVAAYEKAIDSFRNSGGKNTDKGSPNLRDTLTAIELYTKLAQGEQAAGERQKALKTLREVQAYTQAVQQLEQVRALQDLASAHKRVEQAKAIPLPSKLLITADKKQLDQVGSGQITLEDFKHLARVEYLTFPEPSDKKSSQEKKE
jgi:tetratricopeptide (TPR) repeat protein